MSYLVSNKFWQQTAERAVKTGAQAVLLAIGASEGFSLFVLDWSIVAGAFLGGAFLSLVTSLASGQFGDTETPSLVG